MAVAAEPAEIASLVGVAAEFSMTVAGVYLGNVQDFAVTDAPAPVTSKDQCKQGGWQALGFEDRQECVRAAEQYAREECVFIRAAHGRTPFGVLYGGGHNDEHAMWRCVRDRSRS